MLTLLALIPTAWRFIALGGLILAAGSFIAYEHHKIIAEGEKIEQQKIEAANGAARKKADQGSAAVDSCGAAGGAWDRNAGLCNQPAR